MKMNGDKKAERMNLILFFATQTMTVEVYH